MNSQKKILFLFGILIGLIILDTLGYMMIEKAYFLDALYMTVISITTVGFTEVFNLSQEGRLFTIFVILSGLGIFFYIAVLIAEHSFEGGLRRILGRRKMKMLSKMSQHIVVAGFGRMGEHVCRELALKKKKFVIIENDPQRFALAEEKGYNVTREDATSEEVLRTLRIDKAVIFIALLSSDADNMFSILNARDLNPKVFIITRALQGRNEKKLCKMGANRVISPYELSSKRIVNTVLKPNVVDFIDIMTYSEQLSLSIEEINIKETSPFVGKKIMNSGLRENYNTIVVAIKRNGEMVFNPPSTHMIKHNDILILLGEKEKLMSID